MAITLKRRTEVSSLLGEARSTTYDRINSGLLPPCIPTSGRIAAWPDYEIEAIIRARIAGWSDDKIRALVAEQVSARKSIDIEVDGGRSNAL